MNKSSILSPRLLDVLAAIALLGAVLAGFLFGTESTTMAESANSAIRVEVHRYMGYEDLLVKYLSLPYDLTVNANETIQALDIGFLPLIFVPLLLLWGLKKDWMKWVVMGLCLFLMLISTSTGMVYGKDFEKILTDSPAFSEYTETLPSGEGPIGKTVAIIYSGFLKIYTGLGEGILRNSEDRNAYTYPILVGLFLLFFFISEKRMSDIGSSHRSFFVFLITYLFLFLILSAGVIWYGFLAFPLLLLGICWSIYKNRDSKVLHQRILHYGFLLVTGVSVLLGFVQRLSSITLSSLQIDNLKGKRLYDPSLLNYQIGEFNKEEVVQGFFPNIVPAFNQINKETESLIYKVGGRYNFFIQKNDKRIYPDDQLAFFQQILNKYPDKIQVCNLLKSSGFKYILVDLLLPTMDNTPEKALIKKYENFLTFLYQNPKIKLLATDRKLLLQQNGTSKFVNGIFGDVQHYGSYAVFEIQ